MRFTAIAISREARPPCSSLESVSLPTWSVPNGWPSENIGRLASRMSPPTGAGSDRIVGPRKHATSIRTITADGIVSSSDWVRRPRRCGSAAAPASSSGAVVSGAAMTHAGVEDRVEQVRDEVREHDDHGEDENDALDHRDVAVRDGLQELLADARQGKDLLDDHRGTDERPEIEPDDREQAEQRVAEGVPDEHAPRADALRLGRRHVVLAQHLIDDVRAQQSGVEAEQREPD